MEDSLFEEKQYFRQWWLWLIMLLIIGDMLWQMIKGFMEIGTEPVERVLCDILLPIISLIIVMFFKMANLHARITKDGI